jgi:ribosomal protein S12 methylthiotransferase accessory factor
MSVAPPIDVADGARLYTSGTVRSRDPAATLRLLLPHLDRYGITRLANVTGLDRIGIPVYQAIRPNSRGLSLSQGKGVDPIAAQVSALMESLECYHAEQGHLPLQIETRRALVAAHRVVNPWRLPLSRVSEYHDDRPLPWVKSRELRSGEPWFVPYELVHANATVPRLPGSGCFVFSTNGLASGNDRTEAVLHGVCELVERDAEAMWHVASEERRRQRRVDLSTVDDEIATRLLRQYRDAGIEVIIWDMTSDIEVATFRVAILDPETDPELNPYPATYGAGSHPERGVALCRALTEAAQTRLTAIAGAREDLSRERFAELTTRAVLEEHRRVLVEPTPRSLAEAPTFQASTIGAELDFVVAALERRGHAEVLVVDLPSELSDFAFTRTLVPGLEGPIQSPSYRPGARARREAS